MVMTKTKLAKAYAKLHRVPDWNSPKISQAKKRKIAKENYELNHPYGY
jgi:ribosomal protein L39E